MRTLLFLLATAASSQAQCGLACFSGTPGVLPGNPPLCVVGVSSASELERRQHIDIADGEPSRLLTREAQCDVNGRTTSEVKTTTDADGTRLDASRLDLAYDSADRVVRATLSRHSGGTWAPALRDALAYDSAGRQVLYRRETHDGGEWRLDIRNVSAFDGEGRLVQSISETWSRQKNEGYVNSKIDRTYSGARTVEVRSSRQDTTVAWVPRSRFETVVDGDGRPVLSVERGVDASGAAQEETRRFLYEYSASGDTLRTFQLMEAGAWVNSSQTETQTSGDGRTRVRTLSFWTPSRSEWTLINRETDRLDGAGRRVERVIETQDYVNGGVVFERRNRRAYTASGLRSESTYELWIEGTDSWALDYRDRREYDLEGQIVVSEFIALTALTGQIWDGHRVETTYEADGRLASQTSYIERGEGWQLSSLSSFSHGSPVAVVPPVQRTLDLAVWPNPARETARVQIRLSRAGPARVEVLDALGRRLVLVFEGTVTEGLADVPLSISALAPGRYYVRMESDGDVVSRPLTVVR